MGFNTSAIILNDYLEGIRKDKDFGEKLVSAILSLSLRMHGSSGIDVHPGATVLESHHADDVAVIAVGGNYMSQLGAYYMPYGRHDTEEGQVELLRRLADQFGYTLRKKPKK